MKVPYPGYGPRGYEGRMDSHLVPMVRDLRRLLLDAQRLILQDDLRLRPGELEELAGLLVDFAADLHSGTGIWAAYERYNMELFGVPLPLTSEDGFPRAPAATRSLPSPWARGARCPGPDS
jgi:hypothetical protein